MAGLNRAYKRRPTGLPLSFGTALEGWYDFKDLSTLFQNSNGTTAVTTDANPVGYWADKSGKGRHLIQATSGDRPVYYSGDSKGIFFDYTGTNYTNLKCVNGATWAGNLNTFTIFMIYTPTSIGSYSRIPTILSFGHSTNPYAVNMTCDGFFQTTDSVSNTRQYAYSTSKIIPENYLGTYSNVKQLHTIVKDSSTTQTALKDRTQMTLAGSFTSQTSYTDLIFGYNPISQISSYFSGYIKEILIYSRNLSSIEYYNLIDYLIAKYSVNISYSYPASAPTCPTTTTTTTTAAPTTTTTTTTAAPSSAGYYCVCDPNVSGVGQCGYYTSDPSQIQQNEGFFITGPYATSQQCASNCNVSCAL